MRLTAGDGQSHDLQQHDGAELKGPLLLEPVAGAKGALLLLFEMELTTDTRGELL